MTQSLAHLRDWIGRRETCTDIAAAWPIAAFSATLDRDDPEPKSGDPIPPCGHWLYFLEAKPASQLGPDGHPKRGGFLPPVPLPRRMWAGGRLEFRRAIHIGEQLRRDSEILSVEPKQGKSGDLVFVTVRHTVHAAEDIAIVEEHDIVYREAARPGAAAPVGKPAPATAAWQREVDPNPVMLFRYSALTFNGHRIHYDLDYVRNEEHYPGLVVHGPLQTTLLLDLARRHDPRPVKSLAYRAMSPVFHTDRLLVCGTPAADGASAELWTTTASGAVAMAGTARF